MRPLALPRPRARGAALTPMIDVVFLLLIFFILVARFGPEEGIDLMLGAGGGPVEGPPRLLDVGATELKLNGVAVAVDELPGRLDALGLPPGAVIVLRPERDADLQRIVEVMDLLRQAGREELAITEAAR